MRPKPVRTRAERGPGASLALASLMPAIGRWAFLLLLAALTAVLSRGAFLQPRNLLNVVRQSSFIGIVSLGQLLVMLSGGMDLSVGAVIGVSDVTAAKCAVAGHPPLVCLALAVAVGGAFGLLNAALVTRGRMTPFIATLATMGLARSLAYVATGGSNVYGVPESFTVFGRGTVAGVPGPIVIWAVCAVACYAFLRTTVGWETYAVGANERAAYLSGVAVTRRRLVAYTLSGALAGLTGGVWASRLWIGEPTAGGLSHFDSIAAAVLGGASFFGGEGTVAGTVVGTLTMSTLDNVMSILNVDVYLQQAAKGVIILAAIIAYSRAWFGTAERG